MHSGTYPGCFYSCKQFKVEVKQREFSSVRDLKALGLLAWFVAKDHQGNSLTGRWFGSIKDGLNYLRKRVTHNVPALLVEIGS